MATFNNREWIDQIIKNNGWIDECNEDRDAPDNPPCVRIVEYTTLEGATVWGVVMANERNKDRYNEETIYVRGPRTIWERT